MKEQYHLYLSGRVQGVSFRYYTKKKADGIGVVGWVRNLPDGRVEVVCSGEKEEISKFIKWCQTGPKSARVDSIDLYKEKIDNNYLDFKIRYYEKY